MISKRREFLKLSSALVSGVALTGFSSSLLSCSNSDTANKIVENYPFGLQLYTVRDVMAEDPKDVLKKIASFGYKQVESYEHDKLGMYWGMKYTEFKKHLDGLGMVILSSHCKVIENFERKVAEAAEIGIEYMICPSMQKKTLDEYKKVAANFNRYGEICKKNGIRFAYHNHDYSFKPVEGKFPQDIFMDDTDKNLVFFEMDVYWVVTAGQDPIAWMKAHPGRFKLLHVKDRMKNIPATETNGSVTLGKGIIDFPKILKETKSFGAKHYLVEQERYTDTTPLKAAEDGAAYMRSLKLFV